MYNAAIIGKHDDILAYKAVGLAAYDVDEYNFADLVKQLERQNFAVIFVIEDIYELNADIIDKYTDSVLPAFIAIPGIKGATGIGIRNIRKSTERAIGVDILAND